ncbi:transketolase family protein [Candidatus Berkelbacteria bacterium]|nr:transketolase family protein [Candidatus Berkelbacteria bacterium]
MTELKFINDVNSNYKDELTSCRDGFGETLVELAKDNQDIVALSADLTESTRVEDFAKKFPERFIEVGVAEQNMAGIAAGLAISGKIPFITSYAVFSPGRNWDQIRVSICYSKSNVKIIGAHAGISVGADGATHQGLEDMAITRVLPNLVVLCPADKIETQKAVIEAVKHHGPVYIRFGREKTSQLTVNSSPFKIGKGFEILHGTDVTIIACGAMLARSLNAIEKLNGSLSVGLINMPSIKPIDKELIIDVAKNTGAIVTAEEHQITGGLGSAVAEVLSESVPTPIIRVGMLDRFGESGEPNLLMDHYGMGVDDIIAAVKRAHKLKNAS